MDAKQKGVGGDEPTFDPLNLPLKGHHVIKLHVSGCLQLAKTCQYNSRTMTNTPLLQSRMTKFILLSSFLHLTFYGEYHASPLGFYWRPGAYT